MCKQQLNCIKCSFLFHLKIKEKTTKFQKRKWKINSNSKNSKNDSSLCYIVFSILPAFGSVSKKNNDGKLNQSIELLLLRWHFH